MSAKSSRTVKLPPPPKPPRPMEELQQEAQRYMAELAQTSYQKFLFERREAELNDIILNLNQEGAARKALDEKAKETQEIPNENA